jgi:RNA polymerase sigma-70 factor (ECF subfamily)
MHLLLRESLMPESDGEYVQLCRDGHPEVFRQLVARHQAPLMGYLAGRLANEADAIEAAQETMVRAYFALPKLRKPESFSSWLLAIADRVAHEMRRDDRRHVALHHAEALADPVPSPACERSHSDAKLSRVVADLPAAYRDVVLLRFYRGLSCAEISAHLHVSLGTVTSRLSRAYALLRDALRKEDVDQEFES